MELPRQRRAKKNKYLAMYPQGILDIIQTFYPERSLDLSEDPEKFLQLEALFSEEEWIDILSKSRLSYEQWVKLKKQRIRNIK